MNIADVAAYLNFDMVASPNYIFMVYDGDESGFEAPVVVPDGSVAIEDLADLPQRVNLRQDAVGQVRAVEVADQDFGVVQSELRNDVARLGLLDRRREKREVGDINLRKTVWHFAEAVDRRRMPRQQQ